MIFRNNIPMKNILNGSVPSMHHRISVMSIKTSTENKLLSNEFCMTGEKFWGYIHSSSIVKKKNNVFDNFFVIISNISEKCLISSGFNWKNRYFQRYSRIQPINQNVGYVYVKDITENGLEQVSFNEQYFSFP
ncbi:hypothetical protein [Candidatus Nesciobacter abundans]|uniref:Uncharacterized protein n=1 Tax=Candidatus Nesciobacter abundans TaxID=2601668 RepID=A0A5C0UG16_9PROT|nr:hypothetical protein [Candidatus Nesciobacter abundans]QEK39046.1 hypothetical protein FZC36_01175 [Candidatus Nesciobacter abundans]